jgi:hypothetical protein
MLPVNEIWGCMHEFNSTAYICTNDISNASSTWVGLIAGVGIGSVITWWVYYRQKKIAEKQDHALAHMVKLEQTMIVMEKRILENTVIGQKI